MDTLIPAGTNIVKQSNNLNKKVQMQSKENFTVKIYVEIKVDSTKLIQSIVTQILYNILLK